MRALDTGSRLNVLLAVCRYELLQRGRSSLLRILSLARPFAISTLHVDRVDALVQQVPRLVGSSAGTLHGCASSLDAGAVGRS